MGDRLKLRKYYNIFFGVFQPESEEKLNTYGISGCENAPKTTEIKIPRMLTIRETAELFGLPVHFVRDKVNSGEVVAVKAGRKFLVNVDRFADYLNGCTVLINQSCSTENNAPRIAPIPLRR